jgi:hypothetical protein
MFYSDCVIMCEHFAPNFGDKRTGCCITTTHHLTLNFLPGNFLTKNNKTVITHPPYFCLFPQQKIKLKGRHFDMIAVMEAESQAVLKNCTEQYFQDTFKKWQKRWERCISAEGDYFEGDGDQ